MEYFHAAILGIVQGIAEFLPVSSSGHLVIVDELLKHYSGTTIPTESVTMSVSLHFGTLLSILVVYRSELSGIVKNKHLMGLIVLATIPVGMAGIFLHDRVDSLFNTPLPAGGALIVTAVLLVAGRQLQRQQQQTRQLSVSTAGIVGLFQAIAIVPGISRSGSTIAAGLACGLNREQAARFSFLIAVPAVAGAAFVKAKSLATGETSVEANLLPVALGTLLAFLVGIATLSWLLTIVTADRLHWFAGYCALAGITTILWQLSLTSSDGHESASHPVRNHVAQKALHSVRQSDRTLLFP